MVDTNHPPFSTGTPSNPFGADPIELINRARGPASAPVPADADVIARDAKALARAHHRPQLPNLPLPPQVQPALDRYDALAARWAETRLAVEQGKAQQATLTRDAQMARVAAAETGKAMPAPPKNDGTNAVAQAEAESAAVRVALDRSAQQVTQALRDAAVDLHAIAAEQYLTHRDRARHALDEAEAALSTVVADLVELGAVDRDLLSPRIPGHVVIDGGEGETDRTKLLARGCFLRDVLTNSCADLTSAAPQMRVDFVRRWLNDQPVALDRIVTDCLAEVIAQQNPTD